MTRKKSNLTPIDGGKPTWKSPPNLTDPAALNLFQASLEIISSRDPVIASDISVVASAAFAAQDENRFRKLSHEAFEADEYGAMLKLALAAEKAAGSKIRHLQRVQLTGERRFRRGSKDMKTIAAKNSDTLEGRWSEL